jgi:asparagine synthase (glutamine-hydrolysing)
MCGIVGIFSQDAPIAADALHRSLKALRHRGPDGEGFWLAEDGRAALGHARLSIIDLTSGAQPIANEDETLRIIVNGEFYGYEAIQKQLVAAGHRLRTRSDSEIALHLYEDCGVQCLHQLRGEFAIILWDSANRKVFAARDRFGIKPLFFAVHQSRLYLGSEVKSLFAAGVPARWNCESLYNACGVEGRETGTLYDRVFQVPPGHYLTASGQQIQLHKYWDFDYPCEEASGPARSDAEYAAEFRAALEEAVRIRLRADVPVGCYLSGGIDSCAVLGLGARHHAGAIRAFTLTFDRPEYNEGEIAREMASRAGAEYVPVPIDQADLADHFEAATAQSESLSVNSHGVAKYLLSRAVRDAGYKVVLTGEGSDEVLGGYLHFRRDMIARRDNRLAAGPATSGGPTGPGINSSTLQEAQLNGRAPSLTQVRRLLGFVPCWIETASALSAKMDCMLDGDFREKYRECDGFKMFVEGADFPNQLAGRHPLNQSLYLWAKTRLPKYILTLLGDRMEMAHSVEGRVPFLDHKLVEIMRSQPVSQKIRGATEKYVLRESTRDVITDAVYRKHKHPFLTPPAMLHPQGKLGVLLQDTLRGSTLKSMPFFDARKVATLLDNVNSMDEAARVANDQILMIALSACVLHRRFQLSA